ESDASNEPYQQKVRDLLKDLDMVARLEEIRLEQAHVKEDHFDNTGAAPKYEKAFRDYGIDVVAGSVPDAAELLGRRAIPAASVAALDDWARVSLPKRQGNPLRRQRLLAVARLADHDPVRNRLREALERRETKALTEIADGYLEKADLGPATLAFLAQELE